MTNLSEGDSYTLQTRAQRQSFRGGNSTDNQDETGQSNETSSEDIILISNSSRVQNTPSSCVQADFESSDDAGDTLRSVCSSTLADPSSASNFIGIISEPSPWQSSEAGPHSAILGERPTSFLHGVQELEPVSERHLNNIQKNRPRLEASVSVDPKEPSRKNLLEVTDLDFVEPQSTRSAQDNLDTTDLDLIGSIPSAPAQRNLLDVTDLDFFGPLSITPAQGNLDTVDLDLVESLSSAAARGNLLDVTDLDFHGPLSTEPMQENLLHLTDLDFVGPLSTTPAQGNLDTIDQDLVVSHGSASARGNLLDVTDLEFVEPLSFVPAQENLLDMPDLNSLWPLSSASTQSIPLAQKQATFFKQIWRDLNCRTLINSPS